MKLSEDTILADRYRISRLLGQGGMGAVYLAADLRFREAPVAVKQTLVDGQREDLRKAFQREAMLLNHLRHPALPRVTDFFGHEGSEFLVMEFVPGEDLGAELVRRGMPFPVEKVALWTDRLLDALAYLHSQTPPVIHRDIKPQNVKLTPDGQIVLLDFGLAKGSVGEQLTTTSSVVAGSPFFAPPEQMGGHGTDERADLYSLAATVYRLLTAALPPDANHRSTCFINGTEDPLRPAHLLNPGIPPALSAVLARALSLKKDDRPTSAVAMRDVWREAIRESLPEAARLLPPVSQHVSVEAGGTEVESAWGATEPELQIAAPFEDGSAVVAVIEGIAGPVSNKSRSGDTVLATSPESVSPSGDRSRAGVWIAAAVLVAVACVAFGAWSLWFTGRESVDSRGNTADSSPDPAALSLTGGTVVALGDGLQIEMVYIPAGSFTMGSGAGEYDESPAHLVEISRPFLLGKHEVTQEQWVAVMGDYPSKWSGKAGLPVESVSWVDCQEFIRRLNERTGMQFRLPTEAEWEYACRAGTTGEWAGELERMGWYRGNSGDPRKQNRKFETATASDFARFSEAELEEYFLWQEPNNRTHVVMQKEPNDWGLFDMHGNVWEWCSDWYDAGYYREGPGADPRGPDVGSKRVFRGGSCDERESACRSAYRGTNVRKDLVIGFRLAKSL